jgi:hypothetical protein
MKNAGDHCPTAAGALATPGSVTCPVLRTRGPRRVDARQAGGLPGRLRRMRPRLCRPCAAPGRGLIVSPGGQRSAGEKRAQKGNFRAPNGSRSGSIIAEPTALVRTLHCDGIPMTYRSRWCRTAPFVALLVAPWLTFCSDDDSERTKAPASGAGGGSGAAGRGGAGAGTLECAGCSPPSVCGEPANVCACGCLDGQPFELPSGPFVCKGGCLERARGGAAGAGGAGGAGGASCASAEAGRLCVRGVPDPEIGREVLSADGPVTFQVFPKGCYSSSCTIVREASCEASPATGGAFELTAAFCLESTEGPQGCTADCNGGGVASCERAPAAAGQYRAKLGALEVTFDVPSALPVGGACDGDPLLAYSCSSPFGGVASTISSPSKRTAAMFAKSSAYNPAQGRGLSGRPGGCPRGSHRSGHARWRHLALRSMGSLRAVGGTSNGRQRMVASSGPSRFLGYRPRTHPILRPGGPGRIDLLRAGCPTCHCHDGDPPSLEAGDDRARRAPDEARHAVVVGRPRAEEGSRRAVPRAGAPARGAQRPLKRAAPPFARAGLRFFWTRRHPSEVAAPLSRAVRAPPRGRWAVLESVLGTPEGSLGRSQERFGHPRGVVGPFSRAFWAPLRGQCAALESGCATPMGAFFAGFWGVSALEGGGTSTGSKTS